MDPTNQQATAYWPGWRKFVFCFFFIYFALNFIPWVLYTGIPGFSYLSEFYGKVTDWAVKKANAALFHIREVLVPVNGSGDTSFGWAQTWFNLTIAVIGAFIWQLADRKRRNYFQLNYWLCLSTRYYIALVAFIYGSIKIFTQQMWFPNLSQLATPLGDFLPMRLSWMFIGYSAPYQIFSGIMETMAGLLLLYRKTLTWGALMATGVFLNVMMLNLSYDIPVKIFSIHIVLFCLFLIVNESSRIIRFFVLNKPAPSSGLYDHHFPKKWMRITRILLKTAFIYFALIVPFHSAWESYQSQHAAPARQPIKAGIYDVVRFVVNKDTIPPSYDNSRRWGNMIFDQGGSGSIQTSDTLFRQWYGRGYFDYETDTVKDSLILSVPFQAPILLTLHYVLPDSNTVRLWGVKNKDSLYIELKKSNRHFQLAEKQFHWLSESNR